MTRLILAATVGALVAILLLAVAFVVGHLPSVALIAAVGMVAWLVGGIVHRGLA